MIFLCYIDTLNPVTHEIHRSFPMGWIYRSRERDARKEAHKRYRPQCNQAIVLERSTPSEVGRITGRQYTALGRGTDASFATCYQAMLGARKVVREEARFTNYSHCYPQEGYLPGL